MHDGGGRKLVHQTLIDGGGVLLLELRCGVWQKEWIEDVSVIIGDWSSDGETFEDECNEDNDIGDVTAMVEGSSLSNFEFLFIVVK